MGKVGAGERKPLCKIIGGCEGRSESGGVQGEYGVSLNTCVGCRVMVMRAGEEADVIGRVKDKSKRRTLEGMQLQLGCESR
jgi:hypothetical protein